MPKGSPPQGTHIIRRDARSRVRRGRIEAKVER
jgi:hypothetical protein